MRYQMGLNRNKYIGKIPSFGELEFGENPFKPIDAHDSANQVDGMVYRL